MRDKTIAKLAFGLFLLTTATLFLRPAEIFVFLAGLPIYEALILSTLALSFQSLVGHFRWFMLTRQPVTLCVVGVFVAIVISHMQYFYAGGVLDSGTLFIKTLIYYGLLITTVNTPSRLKTYMLTVAVCSTIMVTMCVLDFHEIFDFEFIVHLDDFDGYNEDDDVVLVHRMRGTGIFQDPNDMAMLIVSTGVLCAYFLTDPAAGKLSVGWLLPMLMLLIGLLETKSRGGLLACGVAGLTLLAVRYGGKIAFVAGIVGVCLLPLIAGRQADINLNEGGTGHERLTLWKEGFEELKSPAILFGTGQGTFSDLVGLAAHNSYVHSYVELGLFGGTMFVGCFFFIGMQLYRMKRLPEPLYNDELQRMHPFISAMIAGVCASIFSLSRCYVVSTYAIVGIAAAYLNLSWLHTESGRPFVIWNFFHAMRLAVASACLFIGLYVFTAIKG